MGAPELRVDIAMSGAPVSNSERVMAQSASGGASWTTDYLNCDCPCAARRIAILAGASGGGVRQAGLVLTRPYARLRSLTPQQVDCAVTFGDTRSTCRTFMWPRSLPRLMNELVLPRPMARCLTKVEAADYLGIGITLFDELRIPAVRFGRRCVYDRVDLDAWLDDYKRRGRAGKELEWPVQTASIDAGSRVSGGLQQNCRTASAYAKALGLKTEMKPRRSSPASS